ncbi:MAG TPA: c-type cytochrome [Telluria sp.]
MKKLLAVLVLSATASAAGMASAADTASMSSSARNRLEQCIGCHGIADYKSDFPEVYRVPKIGGQSAKYIEAALQAYKKGDRVHPQMTPTAQTLSDQDITQLAAYYSQQNANSK